MKGFCFLGRAFVWYDMNGGLRENKVAKAYVMEDMPLLPDLSLIPAPRDGPPRPAPLQPFTQHGPDETLQIFVSSARDAQHAN